MKILMISDDPDTILSYGILSDIIIDYIHDEFDIHYLSLQRKVGKPIERKGQYIKYSCKGRGSRNPENLPKILRQVQPDVVWTNFDVQNIHNIKKYIPPNQLWIGWIPWDHTDESTIERSRDAFQNLDLRFTISKFGYEFMIEHGIKTHGYIYNTIDTEAYHPLKDSKRLNQFKKENRWYNPDHSYLLFVGRPNWRKRMIHMFAIMKELKSRGRTDIKLICHSNLKEQCTECNLEQLIAALNINDMIITSYADPYEGIPKEELNLLYNIADLYFAPHGGEGFCMPIVEAMATETPFAASDYCTTREFAGENLERGFPLPIEFPRERDGRPKRDKGIIRPYPKVVETADILEDALKDKDHLKEMGKKGRKWAIDNCSPGVIAEQWADVFRSLDVKEVKPKL